MEEKKNGHLPPVIELAEMIIAAALTIMIFANVVLRYVFSFGFRWSDELISIVFIYMVFLGIPLGYKYEEHIVVTIFTNLFPAKAKKYLEVLIYIVSALLIVILAGYGPQIVFGKIGHTLTAGLQIPKAYLYAVFPISAIFIVLEIVRKLKQLLGKAKNI